MSNTDIAHFQPVPNEPTGEHNTEAAKIARKKIATLPDPYTAHASPKKEDLVGAVKPHSPAADQRPTAMQALAARTGNARLHISGVGRSEKYGYATGPSTENLEAEEPKSESQTKPAAQAAAIPAVDNPLESSAAIPSKDSSSTDDAFEEATKPADISPKPSSRLKPILTGIIAFAMIFVMFKAPIFISQLGYFSAPQAATIPAPAQKPQIGPEPILTIPKINVNAPVMFAPNNNESVIQKELESGVVHYAGTALPGENGNAVIFGHSSNDWWEPGNYKFVFVLLDKLAVGDTFTANYNSTQYMYKVVETKVVEPTDFSVVAPTAQPTITLITCTPPGTSWKRLVVRAQQISPSPAATASTAPAAGLSGQTLPGSAPSLTERAGNWWHSFTEAFR